MSLCGKVYAGVSTLTIPTLTLAPTLIITEPPQDTNVDVLAVQY